MDDDLDDEDGEVLRIGSDDARSALSDHLDEIFKDFKAAAKGIRELSAHAGRSSSVHAHVSTIVRKLPALHEVAKKETEAWKEYYDFFADEESGARLTAKDKAYEAYRTAQGRAAHIYLQQQRLEGIKESLVQLKAFKQGDTKSTAAQRVEYERGKVRTGDTTASTMQQMLARAEAAQRLTTSGPLRGPREDMLYRLKAASDQSPYIRVMRASLSVMLANLFPGVFTTTPAARQDGYAAAQRRHKEAARHDAEPPASAGDEDGAAGAGGSDAPARAAATDGGPDHSHND